MLRSFERRHSALIFNCAIVIIFICFSILCQISRSKGYSPFVYLSSDAGILASIAAAEDHPENFNRDDLLSDKNNYRFYATIHVPLIRLLSRFNPSYGDSFVSMQGVHVFLQLVGFYLLGLAVFRSKKWAAFFSIICLITVPVGFAERWGYYRDSIPRQSFGALLGFILAAAFYWRQKPVAWPAVMAGIGLMMYVHPVSTPAMAFALWLGFLPNKPDGWSRRKFYCYMAAIGCLFLLITLPFIVNYLKYHQHGSSTLYAELTKIMEERFNDDFANIHLGLLNSLTLIAKSVFPLLGLIGMLVMNGKYLQQFSGIKTINCWMLGILIIAVFIPVTEQQLERYLELIPLQLDMVRGIRLFIPLLLLFFVWAMMTLISGMKRTVKYLALVSMLAATGYWFSQVFINHLVKPNDAIQLLRGKSAREIGITRYDDDLQELISELPLIVADTNAVLCFEVDEQVVRYGALRSLVYSPKDGGFFAYANHGKLLEWHKKTKRIESLADRSWNEKKLNDLLECSREWGADFLVVNCGNSTDFVPAAPKLVWQNGSYSVLAVN